MGHTRTVGAVKSYFSKNKQRLGLDAALAEHLREKEEIKGEEADGQVGALPASPCMARSSVPQAS